MVSQHYSIFNCLRALYRVFVFKQWNTTTASNGEFKLSFLSDTHTSSDVYDLVFFLALSSFIDARFGISLLDVVFLFGYASRERFPV